MTPATRGGLWHHRDFRRLWIGDTVSQLGTSVSRLALPLSALIGQLFAVAFVTGASTVFFDVGYQSYLPELIDRDDLVEGNAKLQASQSVAMVTGPSIGGGPVQALTAPYALVIDALSFLWSAAWINAIRARPARAERLPGRSLRRNIAEGLRFVWGNRPLRAITLTTGISNLFGSASSVLLIVLLARTLGLPPGLIGLTTSASAVGGLLGAAVAARVARKIGQGPAICWSAAVAVQAGLAAPFVHRDWSFVLLLVSLFVFGAAGVIYNITQVSFRQRLCPPALIGRMNATIRFIVFGAMPLGGLLGGALGSGIGVRPALLVTAFAELLALVPAFASPLPRMRELPTAA